MIDVPAIDHYPATWTDTPCYEWEPLDALFQIARDYSRESALMETGYSSWTFLGHSETDQENWMNCALPTVRSKAATHNSNYPANYLVLGNLYELMDQESDEDGDILDHFGLVRWRCNPGNCVDNTEKPAYDDFRAQVAGFDF